MFLYIILMKIKENQVLLIIFLIRVQIQKNIILFMSILAKEIVSKISPLMNTNLVM